MAPSLIELRARPDDRELLLVYADWLESRGDPRGELIAVQDAARHCRTPDEFARARARAGALLRDHVELLPGVPRLPAEDRRLSWALWRDGFIRRLELLIDRREPSFGEGLGGWSRLLASVVAHPSCALLEELLVRVDLRGMPVDETEAALAIVTGGLASVFEPGPALTLWTRRVPIPGVRERLRAGLPRLRVSWSSTDSTVVPPPRGSAITGLERGAAQLRPGDERYDLIWFDDRGHSRDPFAGIDSGFRVHVRGLAEDRLGLGLGRADPLGQRRITHVFDQLASYLDRAASPGHPCLPRALPELMDAIEAGEIGERIAARWRVDPGLLAPGFAGFGERDWWWVEDRCEGRPWVGVFGLGSHELLAFMRAG